MHVYWKDVIGMWKTALILVSVVLVIAACEDGLPESEPTDRQPNSQRQRVPGVDIVAEDVAVDASDRWFVSPLTEHPLLIVKFWEATDVASDIDRSSVRVEGFGIDIEVAGDKEAVMYYMARILSMPAEENADPIDYRMALLAPLDFGDSETPGQTDTEHLAAEIKVAGWPRRRGDRGLAAAVGMNLTGVRRGKSGWVRTRIPKERLMDIRKRMQQAATAGIEVRAVNSVPEETRHESLPFVVESQGRGTWSLASLPLGLIPVQIKETRVGKNQVGVDPQMILATSCVARGIGAVYEVNLSGGPQSLLAQYVSCVLIHSTAGTAVYGSLPRARKQDPDLGGRHDGNPGP